MITLQTPLDYVVLAYVFTTLVLSSIIDAATKRIPNWITIPAIIVGMVLSYIQNWQAGIIVTIILVFLFLTSGLGLYGGMGDLKLFMGLLALTHWDFLNALLISIILFIGIFLVKYPYSVFVSFEKIFDKLRITYPLSLLFIKLQTKCKKKHGNEKMPYAPFITAGYIVYYGLKVIQCLI